MANAAAFSSLVAEQFAGRRGSTSTKSQRRLEGWLEARFVLDPAGGLSLEVTPSCLLHALWFQFGQALAADKKYRRCLLCRDWFELAPDLARTNRRFCTTSCKNKAYRGRREQAVRLRAEGKTPKEIAMELDTTPAVIRRWVKPNSKE